MWLFIYYVCMFQFIGEIDVEVFYKGEFVDCIDVFSKKYSGFLFKEDLVVYEFEWVNLIFVYYCGYDVWEIFLNGQGFVVLMVLNIVKGFEF